MRGPHQYRVPVRRKSVYHTRTFESLREAEDRKRIVEGKVTGDERVDLKSVHSTTLAQACDCNPTVFPGDSKRQRDSLSAPQWNLKDSSVASNADGGACQS